jgi:hypothetical protein
MKSQSAVFHSPIFWSVLHLCRNPAHHYRLPADQSRQLAANDRAGYIRKAGTFVSLYDSINAEVCTCNCRTPMKAGGQRPERRRQGEYDNWFYAAGVCIKG